MRFLNKSVALAAIILSTAVNTGCTSIQKKYEVSGKSISIERKATNRAYVDQLSLKEADGKASMSGQVIWHTSVRGPLEGNFYVDVVDSNNETIKTIEKGFSRLIATKRQSAFTIDLGTLPGPVVKLVISYGD